MKTLLNIPKNIESSKRFLKAGITSAPLILLPACAKKSEPDYFEKHRIEYVTKNKNNFICNKISKTSENEISLVDRINDIDKTIFDNIKKQKDKKPVNRPLSRLFVGLAAAALGGLLGCVQKENKAKFGATVGGIIGASLPGFTTLGIVAVLSGLILSGLAGLIKK